MSEILISLALAFILSVGLNIWLARHAAALQRKIEERDDLIDDLRSSVGGVEREDWRKQVL